MSPNWALAFALLFVTALYQGAECRTWRRDCLTERGERLRLQGEKRAWLRATRRGLNEKQTARLVEAMAEPKALPAGPSEPKQPLRELEPGVFADIKAGVIDRPYDSATTAKQPLPTLPKPGQRFPLPDPSRGLIDPSQVPERMRQFLRELPGWPGTKEASRVS